MASPATETPPLNTRRSGRIKDNKTQNMENNNYEPMDFNSIQGRKRTSLEMSNSLNTFNINEQNNATKISKFNDSNNTNTNTNEIKYNNQDHGPYTVIFQKENIQPAKLGKDLALAKLNDITDSLQISKKLTRVNFKYYYDANKAIENLQLKDFCKYKVFIPKSNIFSTGIVRNIPTDISCEEFYSNCFPNNNIELIERMNSYNTQNKSLSPSETLKITFRSTRLPESVKFYEINLKVQYYIPKPMFCAKCLSYGHRKNFCPKQEERCFDCAKKIISDQDHICEGIGCKFCEKDHKSNSKDCIEYKKQVQIKKIMTIQKKSFKEAKIMVGNDLSNSYSKVFYNNNYTQNFPKLTHKKMDDPKPKSVLRNEKEKPTTQMENDLRKLQLKLKEKEDLLHTVLQKITQYEPNTTGDHIQNDVILCEIGIMLNSTINQKSQNTNEENIIVSSNTI